MDSVAIAQALIRCRSVTPVDDGAIGLVGDLLGGLGFSCQVLDFGQPPDGPVRNLFATIGSGRPHLAFAGHVDVVPAGTGWAVDPYAGEVRDGLLIGRGAADMKAGLAAMIAAAASHGDRHLGRWPGGTLSFLITGDEEGPAIHGTDALVGWLEERAIRPDFCVVGEPTSANRLGDMMKIGRRGSLNARITVRGVQGHVAYPDRADNPIDRLLRILSDLKARHLDDGSDWFQPSNLEVTDLLVGNEATNVIPAKAVARLNIRFNDRHSGDALATWIRATVARHAGDSETEVRISGEAFLTEPGRLSTLVSEAVAAVTGETPALSTSGGTSDARFIRRLCPVVEFGLLGATMHKVDEQVAIADVRTLARIYERLLASLFG